MLQGYRPHTLWVAAFLCPIIWCIAARALPLTALSYTNPSLSMYAVSAYGKIGVADLQHCLSEVEARLDRVVDTIADTGHNDALIGRLKILSSQKDILLQDIKIARAEVGAHIDVTNVLPDLFDEWRAFVASLRELSANVHATREDILYARSRLHDLLGDMVVQPRDGVLWAHIGLNANGLTEVRPLRAKINRDFLVAGA